MTLFQMPVCDFVNDLASSKPAPGGGAVAGLTGALGAALASMVASLALENHRYEANWPEMEKIVHEARDLGNRCLQLMDRDAKVFDDFMAVLKLPKATEEERLTRGAALQEATKNAIAVPLEILSVCTAIGELALATAQRGNKGAITDAAIAADLAALTARAASWNVKINLKTLKDEVYAEHCRRAMEEALRRTAELHATTDAVTEAALA